MVCPWLIARHQLMIVNVSKSCRYWIALQSKLILLADLENGSKCWQGIKAMTPRNCVQIYANVVLDHSCRNALGKQRKSGVDQLKYQSHVFNKNAALRGFNENIVGLLFDGREFLLVSMLLFPWQPFTFGFTEFYYRDRFMERGADCLCRWSRDGQPIWLCLWLQSKREGLYQYRSVKDWVRFEMV